MENNSAAKKHYRACNLCEAICGLVIEHKDGEILSIKGDPDDPLSKGHICPKAVALQDIYHDPKRLKKPVKRTAEGWQEISWQQAYTEAGKNIKKIKQKYGKDAIATYQGNPSVHNYGTLLFSGALKRALDTKNRYSATSLDQLPHQYVAQLMFGHELLIPIPDIDRTDFFLIIGGNPLASNGSMMTAPGMANRLKAVRKRGGKVVVIDPRRTETALKADQHLFIKPATDVYLLLAMLNEIIGNNLVALNKAETYISNLAEVKKIVAPYTAEKIASITGIGAEEIKQLAMNFCAAETAVCHGRMGVSVQEFGTICQWLINVLNIITGNFDSPGGHMFTTPAVKIVRGKTRSSDPRWHSRVSKKREILGELPTAVLAEEISTPGEGQVRGLIVSAGNPVISAPNGKKIEEALAQLEYMVAIDIYVNETTRHANIILPPTTGLEVDHYDLVFNSFAVRNISKYSPPLFSVGADRQHDWQIFKKLAQQIKPVTSLKAKILNWWQTPTRLLNLGLKTGPYSKSHQLSLKKLRSNPHGIDLGPLTSIMPDKLFTSNKKINLAPDILVAGMDDVASRFGENENSPQLKLISRRHLRSNNSWMQGIERLAGGSNRCTLQMNPQDAQANDLADNTMVNISSKVGAIKAPLEVTDEMMPGVVSLPHGWSNSGQANGASINDLTDDNRTDNLSGNAAFSGIEVWISSSCVSCDQYLKTNLNE
jgi:anaerobic selenocysteine-containing dehydrogenase